MVFYKILADIVGNEQNTEISRTQQRIIAIDLVEQSECLFQKSDQKSIVFTVTIKPLEVILAAIAQSYEEAYNQFIGYRENFPFEIKDYKIEEITFTSFQALLSMAYRNDFVNDDEGVLNTFGIIDLSPRYSNCDFGEAMIDSQKDKEAIEKVADELLFTSTMIPEIERIYKKGNTKKLQGHPVHYMVRTDDRDVRKVVYKNLLSALYNNGRIKNKRYSFINYDKHSRLPGTTFEAIYKSSCGGAVVIRYESADESEGEFASRNKYVISALCEVAYKYRQKVLTIVCLPKLANLSKDEFLANFGNTAFVELYDDVVFGEKACAYLNVKAKENQIRPDKKLTNKIEDQKGYTAFELNNIFDEWHRNKLCNEIYPQYKTTTVAKAKIKQEKPKGSAYDRLQSLIGLKNAKSVMNQALNYFKAQKMFADKGLKTERPSMHMVFTGNPGTAKTTVARLFAEIMRENGLLEKGEIYEVGRADLVGKYVGHTAPLVKSAFKKAKGGVLFIDEAYSLVDDRDGMFGDEAINTIVQEMENNRMDTVVIFAGYPDKMEAFLNKNPGLRSRIAFHIPFDDYNISELCDIAELIAKEKGFHIDREAKLKLNDIFENALKKSDFGNGRYARNIVEKAKMAQANRLVNMDFEKVTEKDIFTLLEQDFEIPLEHKIQKTIKIGFCT